MATIQKIRQKINDRAYYLSSHAEEEMAADGFERADVENAIRNGGMMICEFCGGQTVPRKVRKQHWLDGRLYLVENVAAEVCTDCGERYFHATVLDQIDEMLRAEHPVKEHLSVEVVSFA